jgi:ABC-2 type transport system permease protein
MSFNRIKAVFFRYFYVLLKGPQQLSDLFYWPLIDILLWGLTAPWVATQNAEAHFPLMLMTGLILWQIAWRGSVDVSISLLQEFWHRNLVNLFSSPLKVSEWGAGIVLLCLCKFCITITFGVGLVYFFYGLNVFVIGWFFVPFAILLLLFGWTLGLIAASLIIYWGQQLEALAWMVGYLFVPFSAVFYPVSILPSWAQTLGWCLPSTYVFEGMRKILQGGTVPISYFGMAASLALLYLSLSLWLFHFAFQKSRAKGLARLE